MLDNPSTPDPLRSRIIKVSAWSSRVCPVNKSAQDGRDFCIKKYRASRALADKLPFKSSRAHNKVLCLRPRFLHNLPTYDASSDDPSLKLWSTVRTMIFKFLLLGQEFIRYNRPRLSLPPETAIPRADGLLERLSRKLSILRLNLLEIASKSKPTGKPYWHCKSLIASNAKTVS